jgi:hypothetical protein
MLSPLNPTLLKFGTLLHVKFSKFSLATTCAASSPSHHQAARTLCLRKHKCTSPSLDVTYTPSTRPWSDAIQRTPERADATLSAGAAARLPSRSIDAPKSSYDPAAALARHSSAAGGAWLPLDTALVDERSFSSRMRVSCSSNVVFRHDPRRMDYQSRALCLLSLDDETPTFLFPCLPCDLLLHVVCLGIWAWLIPPFSLSVLHSDVPFSFTSCIACITCQLQIIALIDLFLCSFFFGITWLELLRVYLSRYVPCTLSHWGMYGHLYVGW